MEALRSFERSGTKISRSQKQQQQQQHNHQQQKQQQQQHKKNNNNKAVGAPNLARSKTD